jgi:hypothetical protein
MKVLAVTQSLRSTDTYVMWLSVQPIVSALKIFISRQYRIVNELENLDKTTGETPADLWL